MPLQFDPEKAQENLRKHKVSFADTEGVFQDPFAIHMEDPDALDEQRFIAVGLGSAGKVLVVCYTARGDDIRVISARLGPPRAASASNMRAAYNFSKGRRKALLPQKGKTRISIFIDDAVLDEFRARAEKKGTGYQTMINEALRQYLSHSNAPVTEEGLRKVIRQELPAVLRELADK